MDGRIATWNVDNVVIAHSGEAMKEGITQCELYLLFVQGQSKKTYKNRKSYLDSNLGTPDPPTPVQSNIYEGHPLGAEQYVDGGTLDRGSPMSTREYVHSEPLVRNAHENGGGSRTGAVVTNAVMEDLAQKITELLHISQETSARVRNLEERVRRVEAESSVEMSGAESG